MVSLVEADEPVQAEAYRAQWGLPAALVAASGEAVAAAAAKRAATHLPLDLPPGRVRFVDDEAQLDECVPPKDTSFSVFFLRDVFSGLKLAIAGRCPNSLAT